MNILKTTALGLTFLTLASGAALAEGMTKSDGAMKSGSMAAKPMSDAEMKQIKACKAMSHEMMMKDKTCMEMSSKHPDMMKSDGAMSSGATATEGMKK